MCAGCIDAFNELWPELPEDDRMQFLWSCTAYPVGNNTRERLEHFIGSCGKDFGAILTLNEKEFDAAISEIAQGVE